MIPGAAGRAQCPGPSPPSVTAQDQQEGWDEISLPSLLSCPVSAFVLLPDF